MQPYWKMCMRNTANVRMFKISPLTQYWCDALLLLVGTTRVALEISEGREVLASLTLIPVATGQW